MPEKTEHCLVLCHTLLSF